MLTSLVYFLAVVWSDATTVLFVNFDPGDQELAAAFQNVLLVLVPAFAGCLMLAFRKTGRLYIEHLVLALYLHSVWYLLGVLDVLPQRWGLALLESGSPLVYLVAAIQIVARFATLVYAFLALRRFHGLGRLPTALRLAWAMILYILLLPVVLGYIAVMRWMSGEPIRGLILLP